MLIRAAEDGRFGLGAGSGIPLTICPIPSMTGGTGPAWGADGADGRGADGGASKDGGTSFALRCTTVVFGAAATSVASGDAASRYGLRRRRRRFRRGSRGVRRGLSGHCRAVRVSVGKGHAVSRRGQRGRE